MSNRRKTKEERLRQTLANSPFQKKRQEASEELSKIEVYKMSAALQGHKVKETGHGR